MLGVPPIQPRGVGTASQAVVPRQTGNCTMSRHDGPELEDAQGGHECSTQPASVRADSATQNRYGRSPGNVSLAEAAEIIAERFHREYEALAPLYGWATQEASRTTWCQLPDNQRRLMIQTINNLLAHDIISPAGRCQPTTHKDSAYALPKSLDAACNG